MGSGASVTSNTCTYISPHGFGYKHNNEKVQKAEKGENLRWIFNPPTTSKSSYNADFKELGTNFVRNLLRCEYDLPNIPLAQNSHFRSIPKKEVVKKVEVPAVVKKKELLHDRNVRPQVLLPSRSSHYFKQLVLLGDPDQRIHEPRIDPKTQETNVPKSFVIPADKLTKLKMLSK